MFTEKQEFCLVHEHWYFRTLGCKECVELSRKMRPGLPVLTPMGEPRRYANAGFKGYPHFGIPKILLQVIDTPMYAAYRLTARDGRELLNLMIEPDGKASDLRSAV